MTCFNDTLEQEESNITSNISLCNFHTYDLEKVLLDKESSRENFQKSLQGYCDTIEVMRNGDLEYEILKTEGPRSYGVPALQCRKCKTLFEKKEYEVS